VSFGNKISEAWIKAFGRARSNLEFDYRPAGSPAP
jgi:hypothetical protein